MWKDTSSWCKSETDRSIPKSWEYVTDGLRVKLHHHIDYPPEVWLVTCHMLFIDLEELKARDPEEAKLGALEVVRSRARYYASVADKAIQSMMKKRGRK